MIWNWPHGLLNLVTSHYLEYLLFIFFRSIVYESISELIVFYITGKETKQLVIEGGFLLGYVMALRDNVNNNYNNNPHRLHLSPGDSGIRSLQQLKKEEWNWNITKQREQSGEGWGNRINKEMSGEDKRNWVGTTETEV